MINVSYHRSWIVNVGSVKGLKQKQTVIKPFKYKKDGLLTS